MALSAATLVAVVVTGWFVVDVIQRGPPVRGSEAPPPLATSARLAAEWQGLAEAWRSGVRRNRAEWEQMDHDAARILATVLDRLEDLRRAEARQESARLGQLVELLRRDRLEWDALVGINEGGLR